MSKKVGVLFVGINGATANTAVVGIVSESTGYKKSRQGMITADPFFTPLSLIEPSQMVVGGWDLFQENAYDAAIRNAIHDKEMVERLKEPLSAIISQPGIRRLQDVDDQPGHEQIIKGYSTKDTVKKICENIECFREDNGLNDIIIVNISSTEKYWELSTEYNEGDFILDQIKSNNKQLSSGILYAVAAIKSHCAYIDFTPDLTLLSEGLWELAEEYKVPIAGKDGNTGQTLMKTIIARMLKVRNLKLLGWYSTNILGNRDGEVLSREAHKKTKLLDKLGVIEPILGYSDFHHVVNIEHYPPRGDNKEAWDSIDFLGWFDKPMQMKINLLGRDSILAAPLVVDLCRFSTHSLQKGLYGVQEQLSLFFKHPSKAPVCDFLGQYEYLIDYYSKWRE